MKKGETGINPVYKTQFPPLGKERWFLPPGVVVSTHKKNSVSYDNHFIVLGWPSTKVALLIFMATCSESPSPEWQNPKASSDLDLPLIPRRSQTT